MFTLYTSPDIELRLLEPRHGGALFALVEEDREYFSRFQGWPGAMQTPEATRDFLRTMMRHFADCGSPYLGLYYHGELAGGIGLNPSIKWDARSADIFYYIAQRFQGQGLVTRACRALINYAFRELQLHRLTIWAAAGNTRSWAVAERLGFHRDGVLRDSKWLGDRYDDHYVYSLLRAEWENDAAYQEKTAPNRNRRSAFHPHSTETAFSTLATDQIASPTFSQITPVQLRLRDSCCHIAMRSIASCDPCADLLSALCSWGSVSPGSLVLPGANDLLPLRG